MTEATIAGDPARMFDELVAALSAGQVRGPRKFWVLSLAQRIADAHGSGLDEHQVLKEARQIAAT